jgi:hypothetical protein
MPNSYRSLLLCCTSAYIFTAHSFRSALFRNSIMDDSVVDRFFIADSSHGSVRHRGTLRVFVDLPTWMLQLMIRILLCLQRYKI